MGTDLWTFVLVAGVLTLTPGADTMLVLRNVLGGGRSRGIVTTFGICSGLFVHALLSAMGVSVLLLHSATLFHAVKAAGAIYLMWLGWQSLRKVFGGREAGLDDRNGREAPTKPSKCFLEGFLSNVLNPKVVVFYLAFLPQFIHPGDPVVVKSVSLTAIHYGMSILWLTFLSVFLDRVRRYIVGPSFRRWTEGACGLILVGLGLRLMMKGR